MGDNEIYSLFSIARRCYMSKLVKISPVVLEKKIERTTEDERRMTNDERRMQTDSNRSPE